MLCNTFYKPAGGLLAGFSLRPYVPISPVYFAPYKATRAAAMALYNLHNRRGLVLCSLHNFQLFGALYLTKYF